MICNRCKRPVEEELIRHFDTLLPMTGYNYIPPCARCVGCRLPVCKECMIGLGMFMFVCQEECKSLWEAFINGDKKSHPFRIALKRFYESGLTSEDVAALTNTKQELIENIFSRYSNKQIEHQENP